MCFYVSVHVCACVGNTCAFACGSWKNSAGSSCPLWFPSFSLPSLFFYLSFFNYLWGRVLSAWGLPIDQGSWPVNPSDSLSPLFKYWDYNITAILHGYRGFNWNHYACIASTSPTHLFLKPLRCIFDRDLRICFSKPSPVISSTSST